MLSATCQREGVAKERAGPVKGSALGQASPQICTEHLPWALGARGGGAAISVALLFGTLDSGPGYAATGMLRGPMD